MSDIGRKLTLHLPASMVDEMQAEATRLARSRSAVLRLAWTLAKEQIEAQPTAVPRPDWKGAR